MHKIPSVLRIAKMVEEAHERLQKAQANFDQKVKEQQEEWEEEQEFLKKMADIRAKHLAGEEDAGGEARQGADQGDDTSVAQQMGATLEEAMGDFVPPPNSIAGASKEELDKMEIMLKAYNQHALQKQAQKMPSSYIPAEA